MKQNPPSQHTDLPAAPAAAGPTERTDRFRSLAVLSADWYWETDENDRFSLFEAGNETSGALPFGAVIGKTRRELAADPDEPAMRQCSAAVRARQPFREIRYGMKRLVPALRFACISGEPRYEGAVFKGYRGIGRDITSEVRNAARIAELADENLALVENSLDMIALLDTGGHFLRLNAATFDTLGYRPQELLGRRYAELLHPDEIDRVKAVAAGLRTGPGTKQGVVNRWLRKDGTVIYLSVSIRWSEHNQLLYATGRDVTERYRIQNELERSKNDLQSMLESIGDAFFAVNNDWRVIYVNHKAASFVGATVDDAFGRLLLDVAPALASSPVLAYYIEAMETRQNTFFEAFWDASGVWLEVRVYPNANGLSVYFHDITAKREAETALRKSEQRFKNLFEQAGDSIFIADAGLRIVGANQRACQELGYTEAELLALSIMDIVKFSGAATLLGTLRVGERRLYDIETRRKDASIFPAAVNISRFEEGGQEFFQAIVRDMTEWKASHTKARESEQRFREVIEMTPEGYVFADAQGRLIDANLALCTLSGYGKDELVGAALGKLFAFSPWESAGLAQVGPTTVHSVEAVVKHKGGHSVHVLFNGSTKRDGAGQVLSQTGLMTDITERKGAESRLRQLATHDTLTGLPNRALLNERVLQMLTSGPRDSAVAVMFIDLDRFKEVNDSFGHGLGDLLLCEVAGRLKTALRPTDAIARLGGDEFVVAAHCSAGKHSAARIAEKLLATLAAPVNVGGQEVIIGASIGISMFPDDAQTNEALFQSADTAMYRAKAAGRNSFCFFEAEMTVAAKSRMALEVSLHPALARNEFELHYQPRIELATMSIVGMEALIRWNHPQLGLVSPAQFIPIAEDTGLIESIGQWVLEEACTQSGRLMEQFGRPLRVSVNVSAKQLRASAFVGQVGAVLRKTGLPPQLLELELTESALIEDIERTAAMLRELRTIGIKLAVDDFGTGYSGLAYLRRFPIDVLKLDRSFVLQENEGISSLEFIKAFVDMAHALKLSVVAEGVETGEVLDFLRSASCDEVQGYYLARPMALDAFEAYLARLA